MNCEKTDYGAIESWASYCQMREAGFGVFVEGVKLLNEDRDYYCQSVGFDSLLNHSRQNLEKLAEKAKNN
jgi:hypothetical protein